MKKSVFIFSLVLTAALLSSCGAQSPPRSASAAVTEDQIAVEVTKKLSQYYAGLSPGLWDDITFVSYACLSGDGPSKTMPDGTEVVQYAIIPFAMTEEEQLTKFHLYYLTKWDGDDCHCSPVKRVILNGEETIDDDALAALYDKYFETGFIKEELSFQKDIIAEKAGVPVYASSDFPEASAPDEPEAESKSGNEKLMEAWENRNADSEPEEQPQASSAPASSSNPTLGEQNALRSARDYVDMAGFSYTGLIGQLEYEGYSHEESVYGADNCGADWNTEAAESAKDYMDMTAFSRQGLIDQLLYEGYTQEQAEYGAASVGY